jgi:hypothetical protein
MPARGFAVIDLETTGLFPGGHDRIVELAVVHIDDQGLITGQWETLLNPGRDLGPQNDGLERAFPAPREADAAQFVTVKARFSGGRHDPCATRLYPGDTSRTGTLNVEYIGGHLTKTKTRNA